MYKHRVNVSSMDYSRLDYTLATVAAALTCVAAFAGTTIWIALAVATLVTHYTVRCARSAQLVSAHER